MARVLWEVHVRDTVKIELRDEDAGEENADAMFVEVAEPLALLPKFQTLALKHRIRSVLMVVSDVELAVEDHYESRETVRTWRKAIKLWLVGRSVCTNHCM